MSAPVELGETFSYRYTVTNEAGVLGNATVTMQVTKPDGTVDNPSPVNTGLGVFDLDYITTQVGRHVLAGTATGGILGAKVVKFDDVFHVEPPGRMLVGLDEALTQLRASQVITDIPDREQMRSLIIAASDAVERALGIVIARRTITDTFSGGCGYLQLSQVPLSAPDGFVSVISITENGMTVPALTGFVVDRERWRLYRGPGTYNAWWAGGYGNITVTYDAGCLVVPPVVRTIVLASVEAAWQSTQQAAHPMMDPGVTDLMIGEQVRGLSEPERMAWGKLSLSGAGIA